MYVMLVSVQEVSWPRERVLKRIFRSAISKMWIVHAPGPPEEKISILIVFI